MAPIFFYNRVSPTSGHHSKIQLLEEYNDFELFWGNQAFPKPVKAKIFSNMSGVYNDLVYSSTDLVNFAISDRLKNILLENFITGWSTYEVSITNSALKYHGFVLKGRCGDLIKPSTETKSIIVVQGMHFDINTWDGSDFFCPPSTGFLLCTEKVVDLFKKNTIKSTSFINVKDVRWHFAG
jgi:hypothetical protein